MMSNAFSDVSHNRFLRALPGAVAGRLVTLSHVEPLVRGVVLVEMGATAPDIHFPERGLISLVRQMADGRSAEVGVVGVEGLSSVSSLLGVGRSPFEAVVQVEGAGLRIKTGDIHAEMERSPELVGLVTRYMYYKLTQLAQTAACNRLHTLRQRCCRWLCVAQDNVREDEFTLTHEFLALMMGVNRTSLSLVLEALQKQGLVRYRRASLAILDRPELEEGACECYRSLRHELDVVYAAPL